VWLVRMVVIVAERKRRAEGVVMNLSLSIKGWNG
jgi:hypothetical protein